MQKLHKEEEGTLRADVQETLGKKFARRVARI